MSAEIVSLVGAVPLVEATPNETLVKELERLLTAARAGQIVGMAGAYQHHDRIITYSYAGAVGGYAVLGGLDCLKERLVRLAVSRS
jgi:CO dehydrogenase/acetyl-CoA synthase delta subunit